MTGVFTDGSDYYVLTNAHCVKGAVTCKPEDMISRELIQPSLLDGGDPKQDVIAVSVKASNIFESGSTDVAVAKLLDIPWSTRIHGYEKEFTGRTREVNIGDVVFKSGRTTGVTGGTVLFVNVALNIGYPCGRRIVTNSVITSKMLEPGDSGSPVFDAEGNLVGQGIAGSDIVSVFTPISLILEETGLKPAIKKETKKENRENRIIDLIIKIIEWLKRKLGIIWKIFG